MENNIASPIDYEALMRDSDPENTGQALNLITYDKEKGKWQLFTNVFNRFPSFSRGSRDATLPRVN